MIMTHKDERGRAKYRLTIKLDLEWDADLIEWLGAIPKGQRSEVIRGALRDLIQSSSQTDLEAIRSIMAGELSRALAGFQTRGVTLVPRTEDHNLEARFGDRLDHMLGSLQSGAESEGREE
jgi:hypothetical protein